MKCSLGITNFLKEIYSLSHSIVFLYFFALITEEAFYLSMLVFGTLHSNGCIFSFLLCLSLLFCSQLFVKASSDNNLAFFHFFFLSMVLMIASCTMSQTSVYSSSGTLSMFTLISCQTLNCFHT